MPNVNLFIASPKDTLRAVLADQPVRSDPVQLRAFLFDGEDDVSSETVFTWRVSWKGSYRTYSAPVGTSSSLTVSLTLGGDRLSVVALRNGIRYREYAKMSITGTNPTMEQVNRALGKDEVLKAMLWQESTWRQFKSGKPLKNKGSTARGIGQVIEIYWAGGSIAHNDYFRIAWQWDYCIEAARDIFVQYQTLVRRAFPGASRRQVTDWTIYIYHEGPVHLKDSVDPSLNEYVKKTHQLMIEKPWEV